MTRSRRPSTGVVVIGAVTGLLLLAFLASVLHGRLFWGPKACPLLSRSDVAAAPGVHIGAASSFVPAPDDARTTGCYLGTGQDATRAVVYAFDRRAASAYAKAVTALTGQGVTPQYLTGSG